MAQEIKILVDVSKLTHEEVYEMWQAAITEATRDEVTPSLQVAWLEFVAALSARYAYLLRAEMEGGAE